ATPTKRYMLLHRTAPSILRKRCRPSVAKAQVVLFVPFMHRRTLIDSQALEGVGSGLPCAVHCKKDVRHALGVNAINRLPPGQINDLFDFLPGIRALAGRVSAV